MKSCQSAFTLIELLFIVGTLAIVAAVTVRPSQGCKGRSSRITCTSNIKQIGLAFRMWANDHAEKFPMDLAVAEGGTKDLAVLGLSLASFTIISNQLNNSKPLHCPDDEKRKRATQFAQLAAKNISYFLRVDAWQTNPELILTGDRNLCINGRPAYRLVQIDNPSIITWGPNIHKQQGNIGLVDGSAHQVTDLMLQKALKAHGISLNRFAIP